MMLAKLDKPDRRLDPVVRRYELTRGFTT